MDLIFQTYYLSPIPCFLKIYALNRFLGWPFETQVRRAFFFNTDYADARITQTLIALIRRSYHCWHVFHGCVEKDLKTKVWDTQSEFVLEFLKEFDFISTVENKQLEKEDQKNFKSDLFRLSNKQSWLKKENWKHAMRVNF